MQCKDFFGDYSDYRDGLLTGETHAKYERHMAECPRCWRYDRVVDRGVELATSMSTRELSPDFLPRLQHRLYHVEDEGKFTSTRALGNAALVAVASVGLLAVTWLPFATRMSVEIQLPPVAVEAPGATRVDDQPDIFDRGPYVSPLQPFFLPLYPTLDESSDLFTSYSLPMPGESTARGVPVGTQLDSAR